MILIFDVTGQVPGCIIYNFVSYFIDFWIVLIEREDPLSLEPVQDYLFPMACLAADP